MTNYEYQILVQLYGKEYADQARASEKERSEHELLL